MPGVNETLAAVVGDRHVLTDRDVRAGYERDWTGRWGGRAACVVRPGSVEEVQGVVRACREAGAGLVPQGGNSGLVGGGVPRGGEVVLSLARLDGGGEVDPATAQVTAGAPALPAPPPAAVRAGGGAGGPPLAARRPVTVAGAGGSLAALQAAAREAGLDAGLDFAARDTATVGGVVACDAGGARALRNGTARARVAGLEAVLGDGTVVSRLSGLLKDNAGYDVPLLL